ncbi:MAG: hypothetical protein BM556_05570 [Bacteriovorax sp. MedPE-SWde]|nr:MAG: hypothetical protein BM556_05570 [Bacteriovorax sp. MedPE-SWde]
MTRKLKYLSLFSGLGGLDYGLEKAGYNNLGCIEFDKDSCEMLRQNRHWQVFEGDIRDLNISTIKSKIGLKKGELDLLVGGPPCQSYSKSSFWNESTKRGYKDSRGKLIDHYLKYVEEFLPKTFLIENVPGFCYSKQNGGMKTIFKFLKYLKNSFGVEYKIDYKVLNCMDYGVPQKRERFFLVGNRVNKDFSFPEPSHGDISLGLLPYKTTTDAFKNIPDDHFRDEELAVGGKWAELLPCIPAGANYQYFTEKGEGRDIFAYRSRYWTFLLKLSPREPSWTIQASPGSSTGPFHWKNRKLSSRELARIQTLPDSMKLIGSKTALQRMIGNAVPSLIGEILGREIRSQIFSHRRYDKYSLMPDISSKVYRPRVIRNVPQAYLS